MIFHLLGTAAADGIPSLFSDSEVSCYAREHGGREIRTRAAALVDDCLKIDLPPDTLAQVQRDNIDSSAWTCVIFTHSHVDHFAVDEIQYGLFPFNGNEYLPFTIYANRTICDSIRKAYPDWPIELVETHSFEPFQHGGYTIIPFRAKHADEEDSQNLIFQNGASSAMYATDTGIYDEATWEFLKGYIVDLLIIECTNGYHPNDYYGHLDLETCFAVVDRLKAQGTLHPGSKVVTTHHSHLGGATYANLLEALPSHGIEPGFDGMRIEV